MPEEIYGELIKAGVSEQAAEVISSDRILAEKTLRIIRIFSLDPSTLPTKSGSLRMTDIPSFANWFLHHQKEAREKTAEELISLFKQDSADIVSDTKALGDWIIRVIEENPKAVSDFRAGKQPALGFLIGQVQRKARGKADVRIVKDMLSSKLVNDL